jgi:hypothetical protein
MTCCLDQPHFHSIYTDTDPYVFAVAGDPNRGVDWNFDAIMKDREFYGKNYDLFFPKTKKLLTLENEYCGLDVTVLAPKNCYTTDGTEETVKQKGVAIDGDRNAHINRDVFEICIRKGQILDAENCIPRTKGT